MTRKVTAHLFSTLNGVVESPNLWQFDAFGPEEGQLMGEVIGPVTDVIIGRKLWQEWSEYWPSADDPFGQFINPVRKHVVTSYPFWRAALEQHRHRRRPGGLRNEPA